MRGGVHTHTHTLGTNLVALSFRAKSPLGKLPEETQVVFVPPWGFRAHLCVCVCVCG